MNICNWIKRNAEKNPGGVALVFQEKTYSHAELFALVQRFGNALLGLGVRPGDRVGMLLPNCPEFLIARWAAIAIGAAIAPMNVMFQRTEIKYVLNNAQPRLLVTTTDKLDLIEDVWVECPSLEHVIVIDDASVFQTSGFWNLIENASPALELHDCGPDDLCDLYYTSGTTGRPKGVMCTHGSFSALLEYESKVWGAQPDDRYLTVLPLFHTKALIIPCLLAAYNGACQVLLPRWDTELVLRSIQDQRITFFVGVPTMYSYILDSGLVDKYDLSSLRFCRVGGAPIPIEVHRAFEEKFGVTIIEGYGTTGFVGTSHPLSGERVIGSIGKPLGEFDPDIDCQIRIVNDNDEDVPDGEEGELVARGAHVPKGFWRMPGKTRRDYRNGWFHTGDVARRDERGFIYLVGRKDDLIITSGFNVYPREVEELLYGHDAVLEAAVIGVDDDAKGQVIKAFVVLKDGRETSANAIIDFCRARIAHYKAPRQVDFVTSLPKTSSGKVQRRFLKAAAPGAGKE